MSPPLIAVDFGGTSLRAALFDQESPQLARHKKIPTKAADGPDAVIRRMIKSIESVLPKSTKGLRIGVGTPGPVDPYQGVILEAPNLPGWKDVPLQARLENHFGCPVHLGNDGNVAALGEWRFGAGEQADPMLYLTVSTGIGGGVILGGEILLGKQGLAAEFGHMTIDPNGPLCGCGQRGHLEAIAAGPAIARDALARLEAGEESSLQLLRQSGEQVSAVQVGQAANEGDRLALDVVEQAGSVVGLALANLLHIFNAQTIVLGGGVSMIGPAFFDPVVASLHKHILHPAYLTGVSVRPAALGDDAGLVGAMALAASID
jgi:glucokinase